MSLIRSSCLVLLTSVGSLLSYTPVYAAIDITGLDVSKVEIYTDKSMIPDIGSNGAAIPGGEKVAVMRTSNATYGHWKFVAYGDTLNNIQSLWLTAKALGVTVHCVAEDRGNFWVQCVGTGTE